MGHCGQEVLQGGEGCKRKVYSFIEQLWSNHYRNVESCSQNVSNKIMARVIKIWNENVQLWNVFVEARIKRSGTHEGLFVINDVLPFKRLVGVTPELDLRERLMYAFTGVNKAELAQSLKLRGKRVIKDAIYVSRWEYFQMSHFRLRNGSLALNNKVNQTYVNKKSETQCGYQISVPRQHAFTSQDFQ